MSRADAPPPPSGVATRVHPWLGLAVTALGVVQLLAERPDGPVVVLVPAVLACGVAVAAMPWFLVAATVVLGGAVVAMVAAIEIPLFTSFLATMVAAFTLARVGTWRTAPLGAAALLATLVVVAVPELSDPEVGAFGLVYPVVYFGGAALLGWLTRQRARHLQALRDVAASLERERQQQVALAAAAEREALAREIHDVVSHGVSLMVVQAEAAAAVLDRRPDEAADALAAVSETGRAAMNDLHRMLGVLRRAATDLDELSARVRAAGLEVDLDVAPGWARLEEPARVALYRVAQEAVTNVLKHADGADRVTIRLIDSPAESVLEVCDNGSGSRPGRPGLGSGLKGLAERVAQLGGALDATALDEGGFAVRATLPRGAA